MAQYIKNITDTKIIYPPVLWNETQELLKKIENKISGRVISYFTGSNSRIHTEDVKYFYSHLKQIGKQETIYFILVSNGGSGEGAWRIATLLRNYCNKLVIILPEVAASAATILSLAADEIIMTPLSYLTAVDTSIFHPLNPRDQENKPIYVELDEIQRSINVLLKKVDDGNTNEIYKTIFSHIHPIALGAIMRSTTLSEMLCNDIMDLKKEKPDEKFKQKIIKQLNEKYPSHSYPIPRHKAKELGLPITYSDAELDDMLSELNNLYVQITKPSKTYLNDSHINTEWVSTVIESRNLRFGYHLSTRKRLDKLLKNWLTFREESHWFTMQPKNMAGQKVVSQSNIEL